MKRLIIPILFLILISPSLAIQADNDTLDFRFDIGYIAFNESNQGKERGYGSWIANFFDELKARLGILNFTVVADTISPSLILIYPENNATITSIPINFRYNVTDKSTISSCNLTLNDEMIENNTGISQGTNYFTPIKLSNGNYNYSISCTDEFNNVNKSETWNFTVAVGYETPTTGPGGTGITGGGSPFGMNYWDVESLRQNISDEIGIKPGKGFINKFIINYDLFCLEIAKEPEEDIEKVKKDIKEIFEKKYEEYKKDYKAQIISLIILVGLIVFTIVMIKRKRRIIREWLIMKGFIK